MLFKLSLLCMCVAIVCRRTSDEIGESSSIDYEDIKNLILKQEIIEDITTVEEIIHNTTVVILDVLTTIPTLTTNSTGPNSCGIPAITPNLYSVNRIVQGNEAKANSWPWVAALVKPGDRRGSKFICAGTIVASNKIITAAHCIESGEINLRAIAGIVTIEERTVYMQERKVVSQHIHPKYNYDEMYVNGSDIAVVIVERDFQFNDKVSPACLPSDSVTDNAECYTTGWGASGKDQKKHTLRQVKLPIIPLNTCRSMLPSIITDSVICAGGVGGKSTCHGDDGGPLVCKRGEGGAFVLDGVTSFFANECSSPKLPPVFTKVFDFLDFIKISN